MKTIPNTAMIFAAGLGTRMRPITDTIPKPLVKVRGKTLLDYALDTVRDAGVKKVVVNTHYLPEQIEAHVKARRDLEIHISYEPVLLETGGGLVQALPQLGTEPFFVLNSDVILVDGAASLKKLTAAWNDKTDMLLLMKKKDAPDCIGFDGPGDFNLQGDALTHTEKGKPHTHVFTGAQLLHPRILEGKKAEPFSLNSYFWAAKQADGKLARIRGVEHTGAWLHIGTPDAIKKAENFLNR